MHTHKSTSIRILRLRNNEILDKNLNLVNDSVGHGPLWPNPESAGAEICGHQLVKNYHCWLVGIMVIHEDLFRLDG